MSITVLRVFTFCNGAEDKYPWLLQFPLTVKQQFFEYGQHNGQDVVMEHIGKNIQRSRWALACTHHTCGTEKKMSYN